MSDTGEPVVKGDRALREGDTDKLGFEEVAARLATSLTGRQTNDGIVVGLNGKWGSGKSSLLYLVEKKLRKLSENERPSVINFRPWLIGNRDALLVTLFDQLGDAIANIRYSRGDATDVVAKKADKAAERLRKFARMLSNAGDILQIADAVHPGFGIIGRFFSGLRSIDKKQEQPTLSELKSDLTNDLRELNHRIIVTIDDVDRLEPDEVLEILRLVRSVADFPNIIYLLCYDADILAESIKVGAKVLDGSAYLKKIVQLNVMVPIPEAFQLRQWFAIELEQVIEGLSDQVSKRLRDVIDQEGGNQLRTPRSVVRTLDSIRFIWPAVKQDGLDASDLVWLQLVKDGSPKLYRWAESYMANIAAISFRTASVSDTAIDKMQKELVECVKEEAGNLLYFYGLAEILPGIKPVHDANNEDGPVEIFQAISTDERTKAITGRRLASPDHYRLYFSMTAPAHAISQAMINEFWQATDTSGENIAHFLVQLHHQIALNQLRKTDVLLERLKSGNLVGLTQARARNIIEGLGIAMDDLYRIDPSERHFSLNSWERAEKILPTLLNHLGPSRLQVIQHFANSAQAIGFLTSILRTETFAHGKFGDQQKPEEKWIFTEDEFEQFRGIMIERYRLMSWAEINAVPRMAHILFAWNQAGDETGPRRLIAEATKSDEGLLDTLDAFVTSVTSSDVGEYNVLKRSNIEPFMDFDAILVRLQKIKQSDSGNNTVRAVSLLQTIEATRIF